MLQPYLSTLKMGLRFYDDITRLVAYVGFHILFMTVLVESVHSVKYKDCEATTCGKRGLSIRYPFYVSGSGKKLCGYPGFKVRCEGGDPMYGNFSIRSISYKTQSFELASRCKTDPSCFVPHPFTYYREKLFQSSGFHYYLWFFFGCTSTFCTRFPQFHLNCTSDRLNYTFVALTRKEDWPVQKNGSCNSSSAIPVELKVGTPKLTLAGVNNGMLLKDGFTMHWTLLTNESCAKCIHSGGRCGRSNEKDFVCYCSDGSYHEKCGNRGLWLKIRAAPQGTPGYVDPEYYQCYQLTEKSDVYSFGVVLIELISSMPAVDISRERHEISLANFAINKIQTCAFGELIDRNLGFESDSEIHRMTTSVAELAFRCLQQDNEMRPSMDEVLEELKAIARDENAANASLDADEGEDAIAPSPIDNDNVQLLKKMQMTHSPVSVTQKWASSSSSCSAALADV